MARKRDLVWLISFTASKCRQPKEKGAWHVVFYTPIYRNMCAIWRITPQKCSGRASYKNQGVQSHFKGCKTTPKLRILGFYCILFCTPCTPGFAATVLYEGALLPISLVKRNIAKIGNFQSLSVKFTPL